jgi:hypothetical protein
MKSEPRNKRSSAVIGITVVALLSLSRVASADCDAEVDALQFSSDKGAFEVTFEVETSNCAVSSGEFNYTLVLRDGNGVIRNWLRGGSWPKQRTKPGSETIEYDNGASDEELISVVEVQATQCNCDEE